MKCIRLFAGLLLLTTVARSESEPQPLILREAATAPVVDGRAEPVWDGVEGFEFSPDAETARPSLLKLLVFGERVYFLTRWEVQKGDGETRLWFREASGAWRALSVGDETWQTEMGGSDFRETTHTAEWSLPREAISLPDAATREGVLAGIAVSEGAPEEDAGILRWEALPVRYQGAALTRDAKTVARGETISRAMCLRCHPMEGGVFYAGAEPFATLNDRADDLTIWRFIRSGLADMRAYSEEQLAALFVYFRSLPDGEAE